MSDKPESFLKLYNRSPLPAPGADITSSPTYNFSSKTEFTDDSKAIKSREATVFEAYKVDITGDRLLIVPGQSEFIKSGAYDHTDRKLKDTNSATVKKLR